MTCFRLKISLHLPKFLRSSKHRVKKIDTTDDYVDFYWRFLDSAETQTTELNQLPGISDYQKILRFFLSQEEAEMEDNNVDNDDLEDLKKFKVVPTPEEKRTKITADEDTWRMIPRPDKEEAEPPRRPTDAHKFQDVSRLLSGHRNCCPTCCKRSGGEDDLHYACTDVAGPRPLVVKTATVAAVAAAHSEGQADLSMESSLTGSSSWEVTRKPKIQTRASAWV